MDLREHKVAMAVVDYYCNYPELQRNDILHTQEVVSYTRLIATSEGLPQEQISLLCCAAWLHDIGCPLSKERFGNSLPTNQESVGHEVTEELLREMPEFTQAEKEWLADVVGSHHQLRRANELHFNPLFEADMIVNILSGYYSRDKAPNLLRTMIKTPSGVRLFNKLNLL